MRNNKKIKLIERNQCVITGKEDLEQLYVFKKFPIFVGCETESYEKDIFADMDWYISKSSGFIQLKSLLPLEIIYKEQHDAGTIGSLWIEHHKQFAKFIQKYNCISILEIGGAHGLLAGEYKSNYDANVVWTMVEPNPKLLTDVDIDIIPRFFDSGFSINKKINAIVHSHVFEHVYYPMQFISDIAGILNEGEMHIFSVPRMQVMLENGYTNCLNFEHTTYLTEQYIDYILSTNGFSILEKQYYKDNHSIFYATKKTGNRPIKYLPVNYDGNKRVFDSFIKENTDFISMIDENMNSYNDAIFLFGGHIFAQYLLNFGLDESKIDSILDNDLDKQGKRLYGTKLTVKSPKILSNFNNPAVILRAGVYDNEIKTDILENINKNTVFWQ